MTHLRAGAATDVGMVRATNQDQLLLASPLFAVADGMGGHAGGEVASRIAVDVLSAMFAGFERPSPQGLVEAARAANRAVWDQAQGAVELRGMGTTLVALALVDVGNTKELAVANVGDSRAYRLHHGELEQLTSDHSLVQELVDEGQLAADEMPYHPQRHVLTRALGVDPDVAVDVWELSPTDGDRFLLCTDGLVREVGDDQLASILRGLEDPSDAARELVAQAREHGGNDNITVVVVDVDHDAKPVADPALAAEVEPPPSVELEKEASADQPALSRRHCPGRRRREAAGAAGRGTTPRTPLTEVVTVRVAAFVLLLVGLLAVAGAGIGLYARGSYFVGLSGNRLTIFQGRPGGLLWFRPTIARQTDVTTTSVLGYHLGALRAGQSEGSLSSAQAYVQNLSAEYSRAIDATTAAVALTAPSPLPGRSAI